MVALCMFPALLIIAVRVHFAVSFVGDTMPAQCGVLLVPAEM